MKCIINTDGQKFARRYACAKRTENLTMNGCSPKLVQCIPSLPKCFCSIKDSNLSMFESMLRVICMKIVQTAHGPLQIDVFG